VARQKNPLVLRAEYYPLRFLLALLRALPFAWSCLLSRTIIRLILAFIPKRRRLIKEQVRLSFPDRSVSEQTAIADDSVANLAKGMTMFARIPAMTWEKMKTMVEIEGFEHIQEAFKQKKGMITFTAHYGCWELMAIYVTHLYPEIAMVVRPLDNPLLDQLVSKIRGSGGGGVIDSRKVLKEGIRLLRHNGILGVLIDQNFYKGGVFVDFFGRPAATNTLVPILSRRTGCAVLPMHNVWKGNKIHIICEPPVPLSNNSNPAAAIEEDTARLTGYVEKWIRQDPGQWLWLHNRWKRQPLPADALFS
jgi:KDO2-lipid IV(A) lauroyltransferase